MILACQKLLGQITKVLGFKRTPPPRMGKTPKKSRIFFLRGSLSPEFWWGLRINNSSIQHSSWMNLDSVFWMVDNWSDTRCPLVYVASMGILGHLTGCRWSHSRFENISVMVRSLKFPPLSLDVDKGACCFAGKSHQEMAFAIANICQKHTDHKMWRKAKKQAVWQCIISGKQFEETSENAQWWKVKQIACCQHLLETHQVHICLMQKKLCVLV